MKILGIESTCDETAAAIVEYKGEITRGSSPRLDLLSSVIHSQIDIHAQFGGVIPEVAARSHIEYANPVVRQALTEADLTFEDIDGVAVSYAPGLVGSLLVGTLTARTYAEVLDRPFYPIHHVEAHVYANFLNEMPPEFPFLALVVSGGHSQIVLFRAHGDYEILGETQDDAVGEAFDKVAKILGLDYPGGPSIAKASLSGDSSAYKLPKARLRGKYDFSFSGLKTAFINACHKLEQTGQPLPKADYTASYQRAIVDSLCDKATLALRDSGLTTLCLAGGVSANRLLRSRMAELAAQQGFTLCMPPLVLCTDNAAMIGSAAYYRLQKGECAALDLNAVPSLSLL